MKPKIRNIILEPKNFFSDLIDVISWKKVIAFVLIVVFFANLGIYIYDKKNPVEVDVYNVEKINSPFIDINTEDGDSQVFLTGSRYLNTGKPLESKIETKNVFNQKQKEENNIAPVSRIKMVTTSLSEGIYSGDTIVLSASDSYDPDGSIKDFRWDFDQSNGLAIDSEGVTATTRYNEPGVYTITLISVDDLNKESSTTMSITVIKKPEEKSNGIIAGLTSSKIDFNDLSYKSRLEIQDASESSFADFQANSYEMLAQAIYSSQRKKLPALPTLSDIELAVGQDPSNIPPVVDSVVPSENNNIFDKRPIVSVGFYGNNEIDTNSIELYLDGVPVTEGITKTKFGVQYKPTEDLQYGQHQAMILLKDSRGLQTTKSWTFNIVDPKSNNENLVKKYEDNEGPKIVMHYPDENAKHVKATSEIRVSFAEPVVQNSVEVAIVDLTTNITKFFTGKQIQWNSLGTGFVIDPNEKVFDYGRGYQIVVKATDENKNNSVNEWFVLAENYNAPEFEITYPKNNEIVNLPQMTVKGFGDPSYFITVNGVIALVKADGTFSAEINLKQGKNEVTVASKNLKEREFSKTIEITYDPSANEGNPIIVPQDSPVIVDSSIRDGEVIDKVKPQISFVFADTDGIDRESVKLLIDDVDVTSQSFIARDSIVYKPLSPLSQGTHKINLIVADTVDNTTNYNMNFTIDAYPENPTGLKVSLANNNKNVMLIWNGVDNLSNPEYRVYRSTSPQVPLTATHEVKRGLSTTTWTDTDVLDGTEYFYTVVAVNPNSVNDNLSKPSNEVNITVDFTAPMLQIVEPKKNVTIEEDTVIVKGIVELGAFLEVTNNFATNYSPSIKTNGEFEVVIDLVPGDNVITTIAKDSDGNESIDVRTIVYQVPDTEAPFVKEYEPKGNKVSVSSDINITYNEEIKPESIKLYIKETSNTDNVNPFIISNLELTLSDDGKTISFKPKTDFKFETLYSVVVYAEDLSGNESVNDDWEFRTEDKLNPEIEIFTPSSDFLIENHYTNISGNIDSDADITITVSTDEGDTPVVYSLGTSTKGNFSKQVELFPYKQNIITIKAVDGYGKETTKVLKGICYPPDTDKPIVAINAPIQNTRTGEDTIRVLGEIIDKREDKVNLVISINGDVQVDKNLTMPTAPSTKINFDENIRLSEGENLIKVIVTDSSGNKTIKGVVVLKDVFGPLLRLINPIDGLTTNQSTIEVRGITDTNLEKIKLKINSTLFELNVLPDGTFNKSVILSVGNNKIEAKAIDSVGNETVVIKTVYYDPVKGVAGANTPVSGADTSVSGVNNSNSSGISNPTTGSSTGDKTVSGQIVDNNVDLNGDMNWTGSDHIKPDDITTDIKNGTSFSSGDQTFSGVTEPEADVTIYQNGVKISNGKSDVKDGSFSTDIDLNEGKNVFLTTSDDVSGNRETEVTVITLDTKGPSLNILSPADNIWIKEDIIKVEGITEPFTKINASLGNNKEVISDEFGRFEFEINTGSDGTKKLTIIATDKLENKTEKNIIVKVDKTEATLSLDSIEYKNGSESLLNISKDYPDGGIIVIPSVSFDIKGTTNEHNAKIEVYANNIKTGFTHSTKNGSFSITGAVQTGRTTNLEVRVYDEAGNTVSRYFRVEVDTDKPLIEIYSNVVNNDINADSVSISGRINNDNNVSLEVRRNGSVQTNTTVNGGFNIDVPLIENINEIVLIATDTAGNTSKKSITVTKNSVGMFTLIPPSVATDTTFNQSTMTAKLNERAQEVDPTKFGGFQNIYDNGANLIDYNDFSDNAEKVAKSEGYRDESFSFISKESGVNGFLDYGFSHLAVGSLGSIVEDTIDSVKDSISSFIDAIKNLLPF